MGIRLPLRAEVELLTAQSHKECGHHTAMLCEHYCVPGPGDINKISHCKAATFCHLPENAVCKQQSQTSEELSLTLKELIPTLMAESEEELRTS